MAKWAFLLLIALISLHIIDALAPPRGAGMPRFAAERITPPEIKEGNTDNKEEKSLRPGERGIVIPGYEGDKERPNEQGELSGPKNDAKRGGGSQMPGDTPYDWWDEWVAKLQDSGSGTS